MSLDFFNSFTAAESILFIIFQLLAFVLGMICMWFLLKKEPKSGND
jgi:hypothetical protein